MMHFSAPGFFEGLGALLSLMALGVGTVLVVSPMVATTPLWNLMIAYLFLHEAEKLNARTALGTIAVVGGTIAITLADRGLNYLDKIKFEDVSITWDRSVSTR